MKVVEKIIAEESMDTLQRRGRSLRRRTLV
jgi:hypothetical protein